MSSVIKVENLSKRYRLGLKEQRKDTLFSQIGHSLTSPIRNFRRLRNMTKFDQDDASIFWALKNINFEVQEGGVLGIIGHNGAGKSTLLKLLSRIAEPTTGSITLKGRVAALLEVGTGFHQDLTGRENIYMNGTILGMTKKEIDRKLDEIVDFSGVTQHLDTPVKFYSSGMKVRLGFSVAAHLDPEILIIDEVLAVGDMSFQRKCLGKMHEVTKGEGRTVIFVSHNMASVQDLCTKVLVLKNGLIDFIGEVNDGIQNYLSADKYHSSAENVWTLDNAPGDNRAKLLSLKAKPTTGKSINFNSGITLEFLVHSNIKNQLLDISFDLRNEQNILIFHHGNYVCEKQKLESDKTYSVIATIQPFLLNEGTYFIDVWLGLGSTEMVGQKVTKAITFEVISSKFDHFSKPIPGIIRPKVDYFME